jgi:hypothetical protein
VELVLFQVPEVIKNIMGTGNQAKSDERFDCLKKGSPVEDVLRKDQRSKDKEVLDPLLGTDRFKNFDKDHIFKLYILFWAKFQEELPGPAPPGSV